mmetsp:Transcript_24119/g.58997  ORF Transcript_24119/g.58997 Transcript_24119/m.58997 type:complete len:180 (+) Transcript_24119:227-766(+)
MDHDSSAGQSQSDTFKDEGSAGEAAAVPPQSLLSQDEVEGIVTQKDTTTTNNDDDDNDETDELPAEVSKEQQIEQAKDAKGDIDIDKHGILKEEEHYADAWNLSLEHANATYQSSTSFTSSTAMGSERSSDHYDPRKSNASERLHQQLQRQSLLEEAKTNPLLLQEQQSATLDGETNRQ